MRRTRNQVYIFTSDDESNNGNVCKDIILGNTLLMPGRIPIIIKKEINMYCQ